MAANESNTLLTPWCRVLLEKLTGLQLVKKSNTLLGNIAYQIQTHLHNINWLKVKTTWLITPSLHPVASKSFLASVFQNPDNCSFFLHFQENSGLIASNRLWLDPSTYFLIIYSQKKSCHITLHKNLTMKLRHNVFYKITSEKYINQPNTFWEFNNCVAWT